jgi:hypothetical protein
VRQLTGGLQVRRVAGADLGSYCLPPFP